MFLLFGLDLAYCIALNSVVASPFYIAYFHAQRWVEMKIKQFDCTDA